IGLAIELEFPFGDTITVAADDRTEKGFRLVEIVPDVVITVDNVREDAVLIGDQEADQTRAVIGNGGGHPIPAFEDIEPGRFSVDAIPESRGIGKAGRSGFGRNSAVGSRGRRRRIIPAGGQQAGEGEYEEKGGFVHIATIDFIRWKCRSRSARYRPSVPCSSLCGTSAPGAVTGHRSHFPSPG